MADKPPQRWSDRYPSGSGRASRPPSDSGVDQAAAEPDQAVQQPVGVVTRSGARAASQAASARASASSVEDVLPEVRGPSGLPARAVSRQSRHTPTPSSSQHPATASFEARPSRFCHVLLGLQPKLHRRTVLVRQWCQTSTLSLLCHPAATPGLQVCTTLKITSHLVITWMGATLPRQRQPSPSHWQCE